MLLFIDESMRTIGGARVGALGGVAIPAPAYNNICSALFSIKRDVFGTQELDQDELKGTRCYSRATFKAEENPQTLHYSFFAAMERFIDVLNDAGATAFAIQTEDCSQLTLRTSDSTRLTAPYVQMLERADEIVRASSRRIGSLHLDQVGHAADRRAANALQNFIARARPALRSGLLQVPHFSHSAVSPGLQAADLVAYLAAGVGRSEERPELARWWAAWSTIGRESAILPSR